MKNAKLKLFVNAELSKAQMKNIQGGTTPAEYCCDLIWIILNHTNEWDESSFEGAAYGVNLCFGNGGYFENGELDCFLYWPQP